MSWLIPYQKPKYESSKRANLIDRMFEVQYTKFEFQQIKEFKLPKKKL